MILLLIGPSGSGKTTIGTLLARRIDAVFADADDFHSEANKEKMRMGHPLTDTDRKPWLAKLNQLLRSWFDSNTDGVLACSALKVSYRQNLKDGIPPGVMVVILLEVPPDALLDRLSRRDHEFMSVTLLKTQLDLLEPLSNTGREFTIVNQGDPEQVVTTIVSSLATVVATP